MEDGKMDSRFRSSGMTTRSAWLRRLSKGSLRLVFREKRDSSPILGMTTPAAGAKFDSLMEDYKKHSFIRKREDCEYQEFRQNLSKPIIDEIDRVLAGHYGLTEEELDFIINYDIKYRMGLGAQDEDENE